MPTITPELQQAAAEIEALDNPGIIKLYLDVRRKYRGLLKQAVRISRGAGGIPSTGACMF